MVLHQSEISCWCKKIIKRFKYWILAARLTGQQPKNVLLIFVATWNFLFIFIADFHVLVLFMVKNMIWAIKKFPSVTRRCRRSQKFVPHLQHPPYELESWNYTQNFDILRVPPYKFRLRKVKTWVWLSKLHPRTYLMAFLVTILGPEI
jgi:hypothetical protein